MISAELLNVILVILDFVFRTVIALSPALVFWVLPSVAALRGLRRRRLDDLPLALWALLVSAVPLLGAIAFWMLKPGVERPSQQLAAMVEGERRPV
jgi:hypothetical protein